MAHRADAANVQYSKSETCVATNQWKVCHQGDGCRKKGLDEGKRKLHMRRYGSDKLDVAIQFSYNGTLPKAEKKGGERVCEMSMSHR